MTARLRTNFLTLLTTRGATMALAVVNSILLARYLGPRDFGLYSYVFGVTTIVFGLADLGLSSHAVRELRLTPQRQHQILGAFANITNTMSLLLSVAVCVVAWLTVQDLITRLGLVLVCLPQLFRAAAVPVRALLTSTEQIPQLGYQELAVRGGTLLLLLATVWLRQGVLTMIWVSAVPLAVSYWYLRRKFWPTAAAQSGRVAEVLAMLRQAWPFTLYAILYAAYFQIDVVILEKLQPLATVGYYGAATRFIYPLLQIPAALMTAAFPRLVSAGPVERRRLTVKLAGSLVGTGAIVAVGLVALAAPLVDRLVGVEYRSAIPTLQIMALYLPVSFGQALALNLLMAAGRMRALVLVYVAGLTANVALNFWLIPIYAQSGCALATLGAEVLVLVVTVICLWRTWPGIPAPTTTGTDTTPASPARD